MLKKTTADAVVFFALDLPRRLELQKYSVFFIPPKRGVVGSLALKLYLPSIKYKG